jgi:phage tail-like protein
MSKKSPTSWLLDGRNAWLVPAGAVATAQGLSVGSVLALDAQPGGPLALNAPDGGLGGLSLPRGVALDDSGDAYLLGKAAPWIKHLDFASDRFARLAAIGTVPGTDSPGDAPRTFRDPGGIAAARPFLYVADTGNRRVQVFVLGNFTLRFVWGPWDAAGNPVAADDPDAWVPADVVSHAGLAYILDRHHGRVYTHRPGDDAPTLVVDSAAPDRFNRLAVDRDGNIYLVATSGPAIDPAVFDPQGRPLAVPAGGGPTDSGRFAARFDTPAIAFDHLERFTVPGHPSLVFDRAGCPTTITPDEPLGPPRLEFEGTWTSVMLDSHIDRCPWDTIELGLAALPPGTVVCVSTLTDNVKHTDADLATLDPDRWVRSLKVAGQMPRPRQPAPDPTHPRVGLVQAREGRYLWIRVELKGDGYVTPEIASIRARYPRRSWVGYLPAVYSDDDDSRRFLERYLAVMQATWNVVDRAITDMPRLFDPQAVPEGARAPFLTYLAGWLNVSLEEAWSVAKKRRHVVAAPRLLRGRGTVEGLRKALLVNLADSAGDAAIAAYPGIPAIVEGFRFRRRLTLGQAGTAELARDEHGRLIRLSGGEPLWGPSVVGRLRLGGYDRLGEARIITEGSPDRDIYDEYANRFRVFVPSAWAPTQADRDTLNRTIASEAPAQAIGKLVLVDPRFRIGVQSTIGLDAIVAAPAGSRLDDPTGHALGEDVALPPRSPRADLRLDAGPRIGIDTNLN